jgi:hypothetical protein
LYTTVKYFMVAMFVTVDLQKKLHAQCVHNLMICQITKFHTPRLNVPPLTAVKPN